MKSYLKPELEILSYDTTAIMDGSDVDIDVSEDDEATITGEEV